MYLIEAKKKKKLEIKIYLRDLREDHWNAVLYKLKLVPMVFLNHEVKGTFPDILEASSKNVRGSSLSVLPQQQNSSPSKKVSPILLISPKCGSLALAQLPCIDACSKANLHARTSLRMIRGGLTFKKKTMENMELFNVITPLDTCHAPKSGQLYQDPLVPLVIY